MTNATRLVAVIGTRAQVIKMAPLLVELERRGLAYRLLLTGQHQATIDELLTEFGVRTERERLYQGPEIKGMAQAGLWMLRTAWKLWRSRGHWVSTPRRETIVLAHGDTFSTLLAVGVGWLARARVAHVEAGLRSHNWRHPFPEELTRVIASALSDIAYCPGEWACDNLSGKRLDIVDTGANTILDALRHALDEPLRPELDIEGPYAVVSVHRFENLYSRSRMNTILETIRRLAENMRVVVVLHPATRKRLTEMNALPELEEDPGVDLRQRMTYVPFMQLVSRARLVVSDGGSNQEELSYLGIPTLLMRMATERQEGIGANVILSEFRQERIDRAIEQAVAGSTHRRDGMALPSYHPTGVIADDLERRLA